MLHVQEKLSAQQIHEEGVYQREGYHIDPWRREGLAP